MIPNGPTQESVTLHSKQRGVDLKGTWFPGYGGLNACLVTIDGQDTDGGAMVVRVEVLLGMDLLGLGHNGDGHGQIVLQHQRVICHGPVGKIKTK